MSAERNVTLTCTVKASSPGLCSQAFISPWWLGRAVYSQPAFYHNSTTPESFFTREWIDKGIRKVVPKFKTKNLPAADASHWVRIPQHLDQLSAEKLQETSSRRSLPTYVTLFMFPSNQLVK